MRGCIALISGALILGLVALAARAAGPEVSWDDLQTAKPMVVDNQPTIAFPPALAALNGKDVTIHGWITPFNLGDGTTVTSFLLTGTPGTCPFCFGAGPESFVLVTAAVPVPADITAELALSGRFEVAANDPTGFYYRLRDARPK
jgi:hypothetical protein